MHIAMLLEMAADADPARVALGPRGSGRSNAELLRLSRQTASWLGRSGLRQVAFIGENCPELPQLLYGCALAGSQLTPINYRLSDPQISQVLSRIAPAVAVSDDPSMPGRIEVAGIRWMDRAELQASIAGLPSDLPGRAEPDPDAVVVQLFTSGTSGEPKAATLRNRHLANYVLGSVEFMNAASDECALVSVPPYHIAGISALLTSTFAGRRTVQLGSFEPADWVRTARAESVTHAMVVPTMLARIIGVLEAESESLPALRHLSYGGGQMPVSLIERALELLGQVDFVNAYGLTETSSTVSLLSPTDHRAAKSSVQPAVRARLGSVGRPVPGIELQIRDEASRPVPAGVGGEIYVRGPQVAGEYAGVDPELPDGWFATRDAGYLDAEGYLFVDGRLDDVIVRGGENISPGEVESALLGHPAVADAGVVGLPDPEWGEQVVAAVVLRAGQLATEDALRCWVRDQLRSARTPQRIAFLDALPYTDTGKLLRRILKAELASSGKG